MTKKKNDIALLIFFIVAALIWSVVEFFMEYWYIFAGFALVLGGIMFFGRTREETVTIETNYAYETKNENPQLEPMPYSESKDFIEYEVFGITDAQVKRLLNVYYESLSEVNTSKDIETVDSRFGVMIDVVEQLIAMSLPELEILIGRVRNFDAEKIFEKAAERYVEKQAREISRLKTDKGKMRRIEKFNSVIDGLENMPEQCKVQTKEMLLMRLNL